MSCEANHEPIFCIVNLSLIKPIFADKQRKWVWSFLTNSACSTKSLKIFAQILFSGWFINLLSGSPLNENNCTSKTCCLRCLHQRASLLRIKDHYQNLGPKIQISDLLVNGTYVLFKLSYVCINKN